MLMAQSATNIAEYDAKQPQGKNFNFPRKKSPKIVFAKTHWIKVMETQRKKYVNVIG